MYACTGGIYEKIMGTVEVIKKLFRGGVIWWGLL